MGFFSKLFRRETYQGEFIEGGVYSVNKGERGYSVVKILRIDHNTVHITLYKNKFKSRPKRVDPSELKVGGINVEDLLQGKAKLNFSDMGAQHIPIDMTGFISSQPKLLLKQPVSPSELEGYNEYLKQGTLTNEGGDKYVGEFKDDDYNGQGTLTYEDGTTYVGEFKDGERHGQGTFTNEDGTTYVGEFKDDDYNGQGTFTFKDGTTYVGEFKDDLPNGQVTATYNDGTTYVGEFKDGYYNGQGTLTLKDGTTYEGEFKDGQFIGESGPKSNLKE